MTTLRVQSDGRILAGVWTSTGGYSPTAYLVRYQRDGTLDTSYGQQGRVELWATVRFYAGVQDLLLQPDGQAVAVGSTSDSNCHVARVSRDGRMVTGRDLSEVKVVNSGAEPMGIALQRDGKLLLSGCELGEGNYQHSGAPVLARLNTDLTFDTTFGQGGLAAVPDTDDVFIQPDGKIIVGTNTLTRLLP